MTESDSIRSENRPADFEEEGISIWLALAIAVALLAVGIWLVRTSQPANFIPSSGENEEAFFSDVIEHALPYTPRLSIVHRDPREIISWQENNKTPVLDPGHLGVKHAVGAAKFRWNSHPVSFSVVKLGAVTAMIYFLEVPWQTLLSEGSIMEMHSHGRDIVSWHHAGRYHVAIPFEAGGTFPDDWKTWLLSPGERPPTP